MKRKPVPEPPESRDAVAAVQGALPLVPGSEDDCCRRLVTRTDEVADRSAAGEWLEFLCALGLARETGGKYVRVREAVPDDALAANFRENVLLAADVLDALADGPADAGEVFDAVADGVPQWERRKRDDWRDVWCERVRRLCEWSALLGLAERTPDGYVATDA